MSMSINNWVVSLLVVAVAGIGAYTFTRPAPTVEVQSPPLGSASSPSVIDGCIEVDGVTKCYRKMKMAQATTTVCALKAPTIASSTLIHLTVDATLSSTTATTVTIAKANSGFATTTIIGNQVANAANAQFTIVASTTAAQNITGTATTFNPGQFVVVGFSGGIGTFSPTGTCVGEWLVVR